MTEPPTRPDGRKPTRRALLGATGLLGAGALGLRLGIPRWLAARPVRPVAELSTRARALVDAAFQGLDRSLLWDAHAHLVGLEEERTGCWVHPRMRSHLAPLEKLRFEVYLAASGVEDGPGADAAYVDRLLALHRAANPAGRLLLLAFDLFVGEDGEEDRERSPFHTPDEAVLALAARHRELVACVSVHPYRRDAIARLERAAEAGAVAVKWLPNAMGIDPMAPRCDAYYDRLVALGLVLLTHTGVERAVHAPDAQRLGNPLRLRRPLDRGVRVVAAHCASLGEHEDLDAGAGHAERAGLELFLRLMGEREHEGRLFGELSAVTLVNRSADVLARLLAAEELHGRLVNGSDYPLPAIDPLISTWQLARRGVLDPEEREPLREVFLANPLLFDLVLKRRLRLLEGGREVRFAPAVFETARLFRA